MAIALPGCEGSRRHVLCHRTFFLHQGSLFARGVDVAAKGVGVYTILRLFSGCLGLNAWSMCVYIVCYLFCYSI